MYSHDIMRLGPNSLKLTMQLRRFSILDMNSSITWSLCYNFSFQVSQSSKTSLISAERSLPREMQQPHFRFQPQHLTPSLMFCFLALWKQPNHSTNLPLPEGDISPRGLPSAHFIRSAHMGDGHKLFLIWCMLAPCYERWRKLLPCLVSCWEIAGQIK